MQLQWSDTKNAIAKLIENELEMESEDSALERESELDGESSKDQNNGEEMALFRKIRRGVKKKRINCSFFFVHF